MTSSAILKEVLDIKSSSPLDYEPNLYNLVEIFDTDVFFESGSTLATHLNKEITNSDQRELSGYVIILGELSKKLSDCLWDLSRIGQYYNHRRDCRDEMKKIKKWYAEAFNFKDSIERCVQNLQNGRYKRKKFTKQIEKARLRFQPTFEELYGLFFGV